MPDGTQDTGTTETTTTQGTPWTASLPEPIRGHEAWKEIPDVGTLANKYLETRRPFAEQLPKDIAADPSFKDLKDLDGLARSYHGQVKLLGVPKDQLLRLPTSDEPKEWDPIYSRLGRPEKPDGYKLTLPEGMQLNPETSKPIFEAAHKAGVSQKQLDTLYTTMRSIGEQQQKAEAAKADAAAAESLGKLKMVRRSTRRSAMPRRCWASWPRRTASTVLPWRPSWTRPGWATAPGWSRSSRVLPSATRKTA
jgi:hypothetical protein